MYELQQEHSSLTLAHKQLQEELEEVTLQKDRLEKAVDAMQSDSDSDSDVDDVDHHPHGSLHKVNASLQESLHKQAAQLDSMRNQNLALEKLNKQMSETLALQTAELKEVKLQLIQLQKQNEPNSTATEVVVEGDSAKQSDREHEEKQNK